MAGREEIDSKGGLEIHSGYDKFLEELESATERYPGWGYCKKTF